MNEKLIKNIEKDLVNGHKIMKIYTYSIEDISSNKIKLNVCGRVLIFNNVPDEYALKQIISPTDNIIDKADLVIANSDANKTYILKNKWGKAGIRI